jgi:predicted RNA-binding Zn ribbon-like protein
MISGAPLRGRAEARDLALDFVNTVLGPRGGEATDDVPRSHGPRRLGGARWRDPAGRWRAAAGAWAPCTPRGSRRPSPRARASSARGRRRASARGRGRVAAERRQALLRAYADALANARLERRGERYGLAFEGDEPEILIWALAAAAFALLSSPRIARLKTCDCCCWFFLDASKNRSRRWCSMEDCGTAVKKRRYVERRRARRRAAAA